MYVCMYSRTSVNPLCAVDANLSQTCAEAMLKLADSLFPEGKWRVVGGERVGGGWAGQKDDCLLLSLRLDPFYDTIVKPTFDFKIMQKLILCLHCKIRGEEASNLLQKLYVHMYS